MPTHRPPDVDAILAERPSLPAAVPTTNGGPVPVDVDGGLVRVGVYTLTPGHALMLCGAVGVAVRAVADGRSAC